MNGLIFNSQTFKIRRSDKSTDRRNCLIWWCYFNIFALANFNSACIIPSLSDFYLALNVNTICWSCDEYSNKEVKCNWSEKRVVFELALKIFNNKPHADHTSVFFIAIVERCFCSTDRTWLTRHRKKPSRKIINTSTLPKETRELTI